jgi:hypothetical protein
MTVHSRFPIVAAGLVVLLALLFPLAAQTLPPSVSIGFLVSTSY